jgi:uncharacterized tellurite resistance protein B-like protein
MYTNLLKAQEEGITHLLYHCCMKDGVFKESELDNISAKLVSLELQKKLNFKDEMTKYKSYRNGITDEPAYLQYLISLIKPVNELALFSWCVELCIVDGSLSPEEESLLNSIATELKLNPEEKNAVQKLMVQRQVVETEKVF